MKTSLCASRVIRLGFIAAFLVVAFVQRTSAQSLPSDIANAVDISGSYRIAPNITYVTANNFEAKLDVYQRRDSDAPKPTLIYIHGGGWVGGTKEQSVLLFAPFMQLGWNVVNVEYRLARVSLAPAAVEDCLCALRWVYKNAKQYGFDTSKLVVMGHSAGGHLALMTGITPASAQLDRECPGDEELKVAAVVDWYGITDVADLLQGENMKTYAVTWLGSDIARQQEIARRVSPLTYVRPGLPPIIAIQGDADPTVPFSHSLRLRDALNKAGVPNQLVVIPGGKHGNFGNEQNRRAYAAILDFLNKNGIATQAAK